MPAAPRPPVPPPLPPGDSKVVAVKKYNAGPPLDLQLTDEPVETIATTKEEEWVTKKTKELTTRRQIATRVQRQIVLEDGKVLQDSGPLVSTTTNEDTETHEHEYTEHRKLDDPPEKEGSDGDDKAAIEGGSTPGKAALVGVEGGLAKAGGKMVTVANPDGKVREIKDKKVLTHEEIDERMETEERQHFGDITDEAYLRAVASGQEDIREALKVCTEEELSKALVKAGPQLVHDSIKSKKTIDTEDKEETRAIQPDGRILTECKVTTEHEEIKDEDLPDADAKSLSSGSVEKVRESGQRWRRTHDEEFVDHMAGGARIAREMRFNADTEEGERFGDPGMDDPHDWDSLSARVRKQRKLQPRTLMQKQKDASALEERKDALTKKPLDFDLEEETRKKETSKWLEHHFGSDSRSSRDSIGDEIDEGPSTSYFNVTIKSQPEVTKPRDPPRVIHSQKPRAPPVPEVVPPPTNRAKGYFQGVSEWSQRRAEEARVREDLSPKPVHSTSPERTRAVRSPVIQRDDSAYVSSSTVNTPYRRVSPERGSPYQNTERRDSPDRAYSPYGPRYRQTPPTQKYKISSDDDMRYDRGPTPPERKRQAERKQRISDDSNRYDSGYRSHSRNETSYREEVIEEPPPDYSPPRAIRIPSRSPSPQPVRSGRKPVQRTRFEEPKPQEKRSVGAAIGQSIRKLVGKIRSASQERRSRGKSARASRSPSPRRDLSSTYKQYGSVDSDPPRLERDSRDSVPRTMERRGRGEPIQRYYLGEDPFGGSIYGKENKYDGAKPQRVPSRKTYINGHHTTSDTDDRNNFTTTLGRFSKSTSKLPNGTDYSRSSQTLPRKLQDEQVHKKSVYHQSSVPLGRQWENERLTNGKRSSSTINVSIVNVSPPQSALGNRTNLSNGLSQGPIKPARTYKALNRSKSFNVHAMEPEMNGHKSSYFASSNRLNNSSIYKSNPHLSRLDETPEQLKSPGIVSIISRSQRDLGHALQEEDEERKENLYSNRFTKKSSLSNGYAKPMENGNVNDKKKIFMKGLLERSPELFHHLHGDEEVNGMNGRSKSPNQYNGTPTKNGYSKQTYFKEDLSYKTSDPYKRDTSSPYRLMNGVDKFKASEGYTSPGYNVVRRGSANSDNYSETFRTVSRSDDPRRPSVTNKVQTVSKKTIPSKDGRLKETIESTETTTVTKSRYLGDDYKLNGVDHRRGSTQSNERRGSNGVVIEVRDYRK